MYLEPDSSDWSKQVARLECWLCVTRGSELRKAKTLDAALRAVASVTSRHDSAVLRHPVRDECHQSLHIGVMAGHIIGKGGKTLRPLLASNPGVKVRFEQDIAHIVGPKSCVNIVARRFRTTIQDVFSKRCQWEAQQERRRRAQQCRRQLKRTTTMSDLMDVLDREREYRVRNLLRRKGKNQGITREHNLVNRKGATPPGKQESLRACRRHNGYNKGSASKVTARCLSFDVKEGLQLMSILGKCLY